jgi:OPA family glycerol-3-phosphate transporter-like MFS transporter
MPQAPAEPSLLPAWLEEIGPILILLLAIAVVLRRLPVIDVGHSRAFRARRVLNWLPLGLLYAFMYMGRYNLGVSKVALGEMQNAAGEALMSNQDFARIFMAGTWVYGIAFLINGPLTDRIGGKRAMLIGAGGSALVNGLMAVCTWALLQGTTSFRLVGEHFPVLIGALYMLNMYFQSFGAVAIVKVNAPWFHVRERGVFGAIFGILISLGIYFAYDWGNLILESESLGLVWVYAMPALLLIGFWLISLLAVRDTPGQAGHKDFKTGDSSEDDTGPQKPAGEVFRMMLRNPVILTIAGIEFCSGFLRQAIMQWFQIFAKQTDGALALKASFVYKNWGLLLCCAGILGGVFAGSISDHLFKSRRGPVSAVLYGLLLLGAIALTFSYTTPAVGWLVVFLSMAVIGVHGMLSGTASMDFGGSKNAGIAVGLIDGFVYLGTGVMSLTYGLLLPREQFDSSGKLIGPVTDPANWLAWPVAMIPVSALGLALAMRVWHASPKRTGAGH